MEWQWRVHSPAGCHTQSGAVTGSGLKSASSFSVQTSKGTVTLLTLAFRCLIICSIYFSIAFYFLTFLSFTVLGLLRDGYFCGHKLIHSTSIAKSHGVSLIWWPGRWSGGHSRCSSYLHWPRDWEERDFTTLPCKYLIAVVISVKKKKHQVLC